MLRSVAAYIFAVALLLLSSSGFRQALSEFRDTEPGSLLFGVLHLVIGTSAVVAAIGLVTRARWAAPSVAIWGVSTAALLAVQPLFEPMDSDAQWSIGLGAAMVSVAAAGVSWFARQLARSAATSRAAAAAASVLPPVPVLPAEARRPANPIIAPAPDAHVSLGTQRHDELPQASGVRIVE